MNIFFILSLLGLGLFFVLPWWLALLLYVPLLAAYLLTAWSARQAQHRPPVTGRRAMIGRRARVLYWSRAGAQVRYQGEVWQAVSDWPLQPDQEVTIEQIEGLKLRVAPLRDRTEI